MPLAGPVLKCTDDVLCALLLEAAELCWIFNEHQDADDFCEKCVANLVFSLIVHHTPFLRCIAFALIQRILIHVS